MTKHPATTEARLRMIVPRVIIWSAASLVGWVVGASAGVDTPSAAAISRSIEAYVWVFAVFVFGYCLGTRRWSAAILVAGAMFFGGASQLLGRHGGQL